MLPKNKKSSLGQFYTTNYEYILTGFSQPPSEIQIIEPFVGNGDLLNFISNRNIFTIESYDIDPKHDWVIERDTILNPPDYTNKYVITNPPYLARNKSNNKTAYDKYDANDLYKCFLLALIAGNACGGILIIPVNFISSIRASDISLRKRFLEKYDITRINIFEEQVFNDTSYSVCSLQFVRNLRFLDGTSLSPPVINFVKDHPFQGGRAFVKNNSTAEIKPIPCYVFPGEKLLENIYLTDANNYTIGGEIYNLPLSSTYTITRATKDYNAEHITNILVKCLDDSAERRIALSYVSDEDRVIDNTNNLTERSYATLVIEPSISSEKQKWLIDQFNQFLNAEREKYNSLFLTNYRESTSIARKRISFGLVFQICSYLLSE